MSSQPKRRRLSRSPSPHALHYTLPTASTAQENAHLHLQAHEASLIRGHEELGSKTETWEECRGGRLIRWTGDRDDGQSVWVDRYDALLLLSSLPPHLPLPLPPSNSAPPSPTPSIGFSDLPSDSEEMFYFPPAEREEIARKKKRRRMELGREERMRALQAEEEGTAEEKEPEETEPSDTQLSLMRKLHQTLSTSPDPAMLEIRILANHGADPRFGFLRKGGQWREIWEAIRSGKEQEVEGEKQVEKKREEGSGGLVEYGSDSDSKSDSDDEATKDADAPTAEPAPVHLAIPSDPFPSIGTTTPPVTNDEERAKREAKAEKVREWARKRKEAREKAEVEAEGGRQGV